MKKIFTKTQIKSELLRAKKIMKMCVARALNRIVLVLICSKDMAKRNIDVAHGL